MWNRHSHQLQSNKRHLLWVWHGTPTLQLLCRAMRRPMQQGKGLEKAAKTHLHQQGNKLVLEHLPWAHAGVQMCYLHPHCHCLHCPLRLLGLLCLLCLLCLLGPLLPACSMRRCLLRTNISMPFQLLHTLAACQSLHRAQMLQFNLKWMLCLLCLLRQHSSPMLRTLLGPRLMPPCLLRTLGLPTPARRGM